MDISSHIQAAWATFHKHRQVLTNKHVSIRSRLKLFASTVTPTITFGLKTCPCNTTQLEQLDVAQRKMLRLIVGWTHVAGEDWSDTMRIMRDRVQAALRIFAVPDWSKHVGEATPVSIEVDQHQVVVFENHCNKVSMAVRVG